ncbi:MAG: CapA family protein [Clostridia bacterium]|nr:CapA family protein [Clostridia bacterium]
MKKATAIFLVVLLFSLCSCSTEVNNTITTQTEETTQTANIPSAEQLSSSVKDSRVTSDFLDFCSEKYGGDLLISLSTSLDKGEYDEDFWYVRTGNTLNVLLDIFSGADKAENYVSLGSNGRESFSMSFAGDINLADDWCLMQHCVTVEGGALGCVSSELVSEMKSADVMIINNEFAFSDRGSPLRGKMYTFRAKTENVEMLKQLGVDAACLANNHVYDYGRNAFFDTLSTLDKAGIKRFGAGKNAEEAQQPLYYVVNGIKVAIIGATRAEKYIMTPEALEDTPGVFRTYDDTRLIRSIEQAKQNSDIVIAFLHWGTEFTSVLEPVQISLGRKCVDAGADAVIGAHPHCLQGMDFYKDKLIAYSLGNFWFNDETVDTGILKLEISSPENISSSFVPCIQKNCETFLATDKKEQTRIFGYLEELSDNLTIDENGKINPS